MTANDSTPETERDPKYHSNPQPHLAEIQVNGRHLRVRRGIWVVRDFKSAVEVPSDYELDQIIQDELKPLSDDSEIDVHGGEKFVSHVRQGGST